MTAERNLRFPFADLSSLIYKKKGKQTQLCRMKSSNVICSKIRINAYKINDDFIAT